MVGQLLSNTNEMLQCILALQNLELNTAQKIIHQLIDSSEGMEA
jgi:hypothetical protein